MRKMIVEVEVSVDGAMGEENVDFWKQIFPFHSADVQEYLNELLFMPDALLMVGRLTNSSPRSGRPDKEKTRIGQYAQVYRVSNSEGAASMERYAHEWGSC
jgi:hypothetical protein